MQNILDNLFGNKSADLNEDLEKGQSEPVVEGVSEVESADFNVSVEDTSEVEEAENEPEIDTEIADEMEATAEETVGKDTVLIEGIRKVFNKYQGLDYELVELKREVLRLITEYEKN